MSTKDSKKGNIVVRGIHAEFKGVKIKAPRSVDGIYTYMYDGNAIDLLIIDHIRLEKKADFDKAIEFLELNKLLFLK